MATERLRAMTSLFIGRNSQPWEYEKTCAALYTLWML
jgi:hypothetical protein